MDYGLIQLRVGEFPSAAGNIFNIFPSQRKDGITCWNHLLNKVFKFASYF